MKIFNKFILSSACFAGLIAVVLTGSSLWRNKVTTNINRKLENSSQTIEAALQLEIALMQEIDTLKDDVLLNKNNSDIEKYQTEFEAQLQKLESLIPDATEIQDIRRRHQFLVRLSRKIIKSNRASSNVNLAG
ncbi:MAG: PAS domain-containing sensor histidine kinase, partial [Cyanobacteria bacterium J06649_11]